jgi:hypothetical protein
MAETRTREQLIAHRDDVLRDLKAQFSHLNHAQTESIRAELEYLAREIAIRT